MEGKAYLLANATYDQGQMTMVMVVLEVSEVCGGKGISRNKCDSRPGADDTESQWSRLC